MAFLTDIDSRAAIKGSRDSLGAQAIWTLLGRQVVGGLTTNTTSVRDFVVLLLGYWFVEKLDEAGSREEALPVFIRWEQRASYARFLAGDTGFRGTTRTRAVLSDGARVTISVTDDRSVKQGEREHEEREKDRTRLRRLLAGCFSANLTQAEE